MGEVKEIEERELDYRALSNDVLTVAVEGAIGDWAVYIGAVPGYNHETEARTVARNGAKLSEDIAKALFPSWKRLHYRA